jgi:hypothetical protein
VIIVPELQKVFILVPRTGSGTLYRELRRVYPKSMLLYRHMERDGCPRGYDRWEHVGFVRHPLLRLWSLYTFMQNFAGGAQVQGGAASADAKRARDQVSRPFVEWVLLNREPWTVPYDIGGHGAWWPVLDRTNGLAENMRSQWTYLRPDLGTKVLKFEDLRRYMLDWGLDASRNVNMTVKPAPQITKAVNDHIARVCAWDLEQDCERQ